MHLAYHRRTTFPRWPSTFPTFLYFLILPSFSLFLLFSLPLPPAHSRTLRVSSRLHSTLALLLSRLSHHQRNNNNNNKKKTKQNTPARFPTAHSSLSSFRHVLDSRRRRCRRSHNFHPPNNIYRIPASECHLKVCRTHLARSSFKLERGEK